MGRVLAIDYGMKRVGLAVTDELRITANPLETVPNKDIFRFLIHYCEKENVDVIVLGHPKRLNNEATHLTKEVVAFKEKLRKLFPKIPCELEDERFTSKLALRAMIDGGMNKKDRRKKENLDKVSAAIILQSYLDRINFSL